MTANEKHSRERERERERRERERMIKIMQMKRGREHISLVILQVNHGKQKFSAYRIRGKASESSDSPIHSSRDMRENARELREGEVREKERREREARERERERIVR